MVEVSGDIVEVQVQVGPPGGRGRRALLSLRWQRVDPLAVTLRLSSEPDHPALPRGTWAVLREFLRYGLEEPTGDGAVRIRPDPRRDMVWFELDGTGRPCCVCVPRALARRFLAETDRLLAPGTEDSAAALEALIERLLRP